MSFINNIQCSLSLSLSLSLPHLGCTGIFPTSPLSASTVPSLSSCCPPSSLLPPIVRVLKMVSILSTSFLHCLRSTQTRSPVASSIYVLNFKKKNYFKKCPSHSIFLTFATLSGQLLESFKQNKRRLQASE